MNNDAIAGRTGGPPRTIILVRHGEKPTGEGPPEGVREDGSPHDQSLIVRGWQRAGALVPFFATPRDPAIETPTSLYAPPPHGPAGDHGRPYQTLAPLAARLRIELDVRFELDQEDRLAADVLGRGGVVLIAWEHKRLPRIVNAILGEATTAPQTWPDDRFDLVWILTAQVRGGFRFTQRPQLLLAGDRAETIGG